LVETVILLSMRPEADSAKVLRDAAQASKVDIEAITANVKQEFAAKEKAMSAKKPWSLTPLGQKAETKLPLLDSCPQSNVFSLR